MLIKNFKNINIGEIIQKIVLEYKIDSDRIYKHFKYSVNELEHIYNSSSLEADIILKWSKFLDYDLFRIYTQHLILYAPPSNSYKKMDNKANVPKFTKNIYTSEIIEFIVDVIEKDEKTIPQVVEEYGIPKTTLYKWIKKHKS